MDAYFKYAPALLRKAERILQNRMDAEDVVQTLFHDLLQQTSVVLDLPYLYTATTHRCLNVLRDKKRQATLLQRHDPLLRGVIRMRCDDHAIGLDLLIRLVQRLDTPCAQVLIFYFYDDMSQDEIATRTGLARRTIGRYMQKIRDAVEALASEGDDDVSST